MDAQIIRILRDTRKTPEEAAAEIRQLQLERAIAFRDAHIDDLQTTR